jgi:hypothetical protein
MLTFSQTTPRARMFSIQGRVDSADRPMRPATKDAPSAKPPRIYWLRSPPSKRSPVIPPLWPAVDPLTHHSTGEADAQA